ncbi:MAG: putative solute:sodium symporter small subunit [Rhodothermales bacterium]|jgi:putative solute:sodium symporter small subunit
MDSSDSNKAYWRTNLRYLGILLSIWFVVSYGCGILFVDQLDTIKVGGFKLGFWFAQQGAIYVFVVLIFVYTWLMNRLDEKYDVQELAAEPAPDSEKKESE